MIVNFSETIREKRKELGLSLRSAAKTAGIDPGYLSRIEEGKAPPSDKVIHKLSLLLQYNEDELLLLAGRLPDSLQELVEREPSRVTSALRNLGTMASIEPGEYHSAPLMAQKGPRAIEDGFSFEEVSEIAEVESWRKEVYRPIYHVHKWWAQRLGSVFRAAILGAAAPRGPSVMELFYEPVQLPGLVVFDPFMGSGTTIGEAHKLGCTVIGRDINPVSYRAVRMALGPVERSEILYLFQCLEETAGKELQKLYKSTDSEGHACDVLYYFWVMTIACP